MTEQMEQMIYDEGFRRGFENGYEACRDELAENMMERIEEDGTLVIGAKDATKVTRVLVEDSEKNGDLYYADRPQGKWIRDRYWSRGVGMGEDYGFFYKCSLCEYEVENGYTRCGFNFCPNCGCDMRGEDNETD